MIIDNDAAFRKRMREDLSGLNCRILDTQNGIIGLEMLKNNHPDLIITELRSCDMHALDILKAVKKTDELIPVIITTEMNDISFAIEAMQAEAYDCIKKPFNVNCLLKTVRRALESRKIAENIAISLSAEEAAENRDQGLVGSTQVMYEIVKMIGIVSMNKVGVIIQGESGTGKELIARTIHNSGITRGKPFIAVNCSALAETLLESELFGHVKGAFTGAIRDKKGKFELAGDGTIFLDEISEISPAIQVKLLRILQEKEFERVGGEYRLPLNARVIAATNKNLYELVMKGEFREDLFYRLNIVKLDVPPLRERKDDIPLLISHLLRKINSQVQKSISKVPYDVLDTLMDYDWPGNVRELENVLLQAVVLSKGEVLESSSIILPALANNPAAHTAPEIPNLCEVERTHIKYVLDNVNWERKKACEILGITEPTLRKKIRDYRLKKSIS